MHLFAGVQINEYFCGLISTFFQSADMALLHIDTSTSVCSVALTDAGTVVFARLSEPGVHHAAVLPLYIQAALKEAEERRMTIEAVAVSEGPGSYTGLRIGVSSAKGLAYGLGAKPVAVPTLELLAFQALQTIDIEEDALLCPMIDARRMEVYTALYDNKLQPVESVHPQVVDKDTFSDLLRQRKVYFIGDGATKCKDIITSDNAVFPDIIHPDAAYMMPLAEKRLAEGKTENIAYFEPFYLKEFVAAASHVKGLQ